ncbi:MAG: hypothetical protein IJV96_06080 [Clostridia bacterium]|nr:hypothetical protein [Clostridia bacterium]
MVFTNSSVFLVPVWFDDYERFLHALGKDGVFLPLREEDTESGYLLRYADGLVENGELCARFAHRDPASIPLFLFEGSGEFHGTPTLSDVRLCCFATGVGFLEYHIRYSDDMRAEDVMSFAFRFKKSIYREASRNPNIPPIPTDKRCLYDVSAELLSFFPSAEIFFTDCADFKKEAISYHTLCYDEALHTEEEWMQAAHNLSRSYNPSFPNATEQDEDYNMLYRPSHEDVWCGTQEGLCSLTLCSAAVEDNYFLSHYKYTHLKKGYFFMFLLLLNQRFAALRYIDEIAQIKISDRVRLEHLNHRIVKLKTTFSFKVISKERIYQSLYHKMYGVLDIDVLLSDLRDNEDQMGILQSSENTKAEARLGKILSVISLLTVASFLIDFSDYLDRFGTLSTWISLGVLAGIAAFAAFLLLKPRFPSRKKK